MFKIQILDTYDISRNRVKSSRYEVTVITHHYFYSDDPRQKLITHSFSCRQKALEFTKKVSKIYNETYQLLSLIHTRINCYQFKTFSNKKSRLDFLSVLFNINELHNIIESSNKSEYAYKHFKNIDSYCYYLRKSLDYLDDYFDERANIENLLKNILKSFVELLLNIDDPAYNSIFLP